MCTCGKRLERKTTTAIVGLESLKLEIDKTKLGRGRILNRKVQHANLRLHVRE
jgi:hypothetical protein